MKTWRPCAPTGRTRDTIFPIPPISPPHNPLYTPCIAPYIYHVYPLYTPYIPSLHPHIHPPLYTPYTPPIYLLGTPDLPPDGGDADQLVGRILCSSVLVLSSSFDTKHRVY